MPAYYTHKFYANDVYNRIDNSKINKDYFLLFAQSFDILYYNSKLGKKNKEVKKLGRTAHYKNTQAFFINAVNIALNNHLEDNSYVRSFILGFLTHYILDSTFHPYIFYKTGVFKQNKETFKYKGQHTLMELQLDYYYFCKDYDIPFYKYKHYKSYELIDKKEELNIFMNQVFKKTFNKDDVATYYFKDLKKWRMVTKYLKNTNVRFLKFVYKFIDKVFKYKKSIGNYSYYIKSIDTTIFNNEHKKWFNPADKKITYNYSIDDLYQNAIDKYLEISNAIIAVLEKKEDIKTLANIIPNVSYFHGLDLSLNKKTKYFEY